MTIDWFEPVEFSDGFPIDRIEVTSNPGTVKGFTATVPPWWPSQPTIADPVKHGFTIKLDGTPSLRDWDDAILMVRQRDVTDVDDLRARAIF